MTKLDERIEHKKFIMAMKACGDIKPVAKRRAGEGILHFTLKAQLLWMLLEAGHNATTEAKTPDGRVYDVIDLDTQINYEVQQDMKIDKVELNTSEYVKDVVVVPIKSFCSLSVEDVGNGLKEYLVI
jgi:hypothetical protein